MNWVISVLTFEHCVMQAAPVEAKPGIPGIPPPMEVEFEFSDVPGLMCLLCARQFKSLEQLKRHNKESDLHKARNSTAVYCPILHGLTFGFVLPLSLRLVPYLSIYANRRTTRTQVFGMLLGRRRPQRKRLPPRSK